LSAEDIAVEHPPGGRGVLIPAQCFREIGLVDSRRFPHYWGDHDFHYRAMKAGYKYFVARDAVVWNTPGKDWSAKGVTGLGSIRGTFWFLFSRRSPMNMPTLRRLLKRHLSPAEYKRIFRPLLRRHLAWLAYEWASRKSAYKLLQSLKRRFSKSASQNISQ
jgi:GT2 family glycosyltransferase